MNTYKEAYEYMIKHKGLPDDFDQWDLRSDEEKPVLSHAKTIAHAAATWGYLPKDFNQWDLKDNDGWTVAHAAVYWLSLPKNFNQWHLKDNKGDTVFETMAKHYEKIPKWFKDWDMVVTDDGETCKDICERITK